jgi:hypothetical protein
MPEPLDPAAVMAAHFTTGDWAHDGVELCADCGENWPCLPYRLAEEVRRLRNSPMWAKYSELVDELAEHKRMAGLTGDGCVPAAAYHDARREGAERALREAARWVETEGPACGYCCDERVAVELRDRADKIAKGDDE